MIIIRQKCFGLFSIFNSRPKTYEDLLKCSQKLESDNEIKLPKDWYSYLKNYYDFTRQYGQKVAELKKRSKIYRNLLDSTFLSPSDEMSVYSEGERRFVELAYVDDSFDDLYSNCPIDVGFNEILWNISGNYYYSTQFLSFPEKYRSIKNLIKTVIGSKLQDIQLNSNWVYNNGGDESGVRELVEIIKTYIKVTTK